MATYAVQAFVTLQNKQRRDQAVAFLEAETAARPTWDRVIITPSDVDLDGNSANALHVEVRFITHDDMMEVYTEAVARFNQLGWLRGSHVQHHVCTHDEATPTPCVISEKEEVE